MPATEVPTYSYISTTDLCSAGQPTLRTPSAENISTECLLQSFLSREVAPIMLHGILGEGIFVANVMALIIGLNWMRRMRQRWAYFLLMTLLSAWLVLSLMSTIIAAV